VIERVGPTSGNLGRIRDRVDRVCDDVGHLFKGLEFYIDEIEEAERVGGSPGGSADRPAADLIPSRHGREAASRPGRPRVEG